MQNLLIVLLLGLLAGCASSHAVLMNDEGQELVCDVESFGILFPHLAANKKFEQCVKDAESRGYKIKTQD